MGILNLEEARLQASAAGWVNVITEPVHSLDESMEPTWVRRSLAPQEGLLRHRRQQLLSDEEIRLVVEFLHQFVCRRGIKDVPLDGQVIVIQEVQESQGRNLSGTVSESCLLKLGSDCL